MIWERLDQFSLSFGSFFLSRPTVQPVPDHRQEKCATTLTRCVSVRQVGHRSQYVRRKASTNTLHLRGRKYINIFSGTRGTAELIFHFLSAVRYTRLRHRAGNICWRSSDFRQRSNAVVVAVGTAEWGVFRIVLQKSLHRTAASRSLPPAGSPAVWDRRVALLGGGIL